MSDIILDPNNRADRPKGKMGRYVRLQYARAIWKKDMSTFKSDIILALKRKFGMSINGRLLGELHKRMWARTDAAFMAEFLADAERCRLVERKQHPPKTKHKKSNDLTEFRHPEKVYESAKLATKIVRENRKVSNGDVKNQLRQMRGRGMNNSRLSAIRDHVAMGTSDQYLELLKSKIVVAPPVPDDPTRDELITILSDRNEGVPNRSAALALLFELDGVPDMPEVVAAARKILAEKKAAQP